MLIDNDARPIPVGRAVMAGLTSAAACTFYGWITREVIGSDIGPWISHIQFLFFGPFSLPIGAIFGFALWWTVQTRRKRSGIALVWLVGCSTVVWFAAVRLVFPVVDVLDGIGWLSDPVKRTVYGIPSGALGALCVVASTALLLEVLRRPLPILCVTAVGAIAATASGLMNDSAFGLTPVFLAWQLGILVTIAILSRG